MSGQRHTPEQIATWRREGGVLLESFFNASEVAAVQADFERVFTAPEQTEPVNAKQGGELGRFSEAQFTHFDAIPFNCSSALNLIGLHPALIAFAKEAMDTDHVHLYQCQAWAKFAGQADYDQPFHCDFVNHTLTVPAADERLNSITILCYFSDVTEAHGPMHYVARSDSEGIAGPEAIFERDPQQAAATQAQLRAVERSSAAPAGSIFPYTIDVFHRGTNLTAAGAHRYAVMSCFKKASNDTIGYHAWPFHHSKPWHKVFDHATPEQLQCLGVHPPGHEFWNEVTLARAAVRYPNWDLAPYRAACR